jgi:early secretory antigenic target protein ESAT-6
MRYQVDAEQIRAGSALTARTVETIRSEVAALHGHLTAMQGAWVGTASTAFADVLTAWNTTAVQVNSSLDQIMQALSVAATQYADTELANTALFRRS